MHQNTEEENRVMKFILITFLLAGCIPEGVIVDAIGDEAIHAVDTEVEDHLIPEFKDMAEKELQNHFPTKSESFE